MAVNLINSNDIEVEQTGENIQLELSDTSYKNYVVDSMSGNEQNKAPSVKSVKDYMKGTILYSNDNPSDNSDITLTDTLNDYSTFEIFGKFYDNFFTENFGAKFLTSTSINERIIINGGRPIANGIANYKAIYVVNSDSLTFTSLGQLASTNSGNQAKTDGKIKIYKVIGYN